jgi:hypothetical protein
MTTLTYCHAGDLTGARYRQLACDPLPKWAADVRADTFTSLVIECLGPIEPDELTFVVGAIEGLEAAKWLVSEAASYLKWMEHVNPTIDEDTALRSMKAVRLRVEARLALLTTPPF